MSRCPNCGERIRYLGLCPVCPAAELDTPSEADEVVVLDGAVFVRVAGPDGSETLDRCLTVADVLALVGGTWKYAYRFIELPEAEAPCLIADLSDMIALRIEDFTGPIPESWGGERMELTEAEKAEANIWFDERRDSWMNELVGTI